MSPGTGTDLADVMVTRRGRVGQIELNRPKAINAITAEMVATISKTLEAWASDDSVGTVVLTGAGDRGFCAGGDIVTIYSDARNESERERNGGGSGSGSGETRSASEQFWRDEYRLNAMIARFGKPFVAIQHGLVLGGGIGLSAHGNIRIVTDSSRLGMPETGIGFVPDVGGTFLLSRAPGELGTHLALTAGAVGAADAIRVGLADHYIAESRLSDVLAELERDDAHRVIDRYRSTAPEGELAGQQPWIDHAYSLDSVAGICERLADIDDDNARAALAAISTKSPTALIATLASLRAAALLPDLETVLEQELCVSLGMLREPDLAEGIRAQLIDKDRQPRWSPTSLADVDARRIAALFEPLGDRALDLRRSTP